MNQVVRTDQVELTDQPVVTDWVAMKDRAFAQDSECGYVSTDW